MDKELKMSKKGNYVEVWDEGYKSLDVTYTESEDTPGNISQLYSYEFVLEDIIHYLPDHKNAKILEVGCGGARNSLYLALRGYDVTCSDYSLEALKYAKRNFSAFGAKATFLQDDFMNTIIPVESFDCVMSFGLLEHFEELGPLVNNLSRLVKPGGIQIHLVITKKISTNMIFNLIWFPYNFLRLALKKRDFRSIIRRSYRDFPHYENSFSHLEYAQAFEKVGNEIIYVEPCDLIGPLLIWPFGLFNWVVRVFRKPLKKLMKATKRTNSRLVMFLSPVFTVLCRKL